MKRNIAILMLALGLCTFTDMTAKKTKGQIATPGSDQRIEYTAGHRYREMMYHMTGAEYIAESGSMVLVWRSDARTQKTAGSIFGSTRK